MEHNFRWRQSRSHWTQQLCNCVTKPLVLPHYFPWRLLPLRTCFFLTVPQLTVCKGLVAVCWRKKEWAVVSFILQRILQGEYCLILIYSHSLQRSPLTERKRKAGWGDLLWPYSPEDKNQKKKNKYPFLLFFFFVQFVVVVVIVIAWSSACLSILCAAQASVHRILKS